jgi:hypothetical protein
MIVGIVKEAAPGERRVAATPDSITKLTQLGFNVAVESGAGLLAGFDDGAYERAGATIGDTASTWRSGVVVKVRPPLDEEAARLERTQTLISFLYPAQNSALVSQLGARGISAIAMDQVPRTTRAQKVDALSSTGNLSGYRAVIEAVAALQRPLGGQTTAAGKIQPCKVLIIGAGVAGHDISTVVFNKEGTALLSIPEIQRNLKELTDPSFMPERQRGWPMCSYFKEAGKAYAEYSSAGTHEGYAGPPPIVHLRRGETLRRYLKPGLEDGKTFVFWGRNYNTGGIPGPERWGSWVNQPEKLWNSKTGAGYREGQARFANAVYTYTPDFGNGDYKEAVVDESESQVTFEFASPYIIGCTPSNSAAWGIYDAGGKNGLVLRGRATCPVSVSVDRGRTWIDGGRFADGMDLSDHVKGYRQYRLRLGAGAKALAGTGLSTTTVCQASVSVIPRLKDGGTRVSFESSGRAVLSAGPTQEQAKTHLVEGSFGSPLAVLELAAPAGATPVSVHASAHMVSFTEPNPRVKYQIEGSTDGGKTWFPIVKDWQILRLGEGPKSGWSQSFVWGERDLSEGPLRVRFSNSGKVEIRRAEAHLVYRTPGKDATRVTFDWTDDAGAHRESRDFPAGKPFDSAQGRPPDWDLKTGKGVVTRWVEYAPVPAR